MPQQPGAPAVVLFKKAELRFMDYPREVSSSLEVAVRLKILTEEGAEYGEVEIHHSGYYRLKNVAGRTVLPDGRIVPLSEESILEERRSRSLKRFVTKLVFPAVEVGAILDYRYTVRWDSLSYLEPWYFHEEIPTRRSEITYIKPGNLSLQSWAVRTTGQQFQNDTRRTTRGSEFRVWVENLPGIPDEPYRFPYADLSSRFMLIPKAIQLAQGRLSLMETWDTTYELYVDDYKAFRRKDRSARRRAAELSTGLSLTGERAAAVHAFVRDELQTRPSLGVAVSEGTTADSVLADLRGAPVEKALLLQVMLKAVGIESDLIWVFDRTGGRADLKVPNPWWFDSALVAVELGGQRLFLDPVDRSVGFGRIAPYYEGTRGLRVSGKKPEILEIPYSSAALHLRRATMSLAVDEEGRITGTGALERQGHQAWRYLRWKEDRKETLAAWQERLETRHPGFTIEDVGVEEDVHDQRLRVTWSLSQRDEEVLGDEVSINPTRPIGPAKQLFPLPAEKRMAPVQMLYGRRDELTWSLSWPEGWRLDVLPNGLDHGSPAGALSWKTDVDEAARRLTVERRFDLSRPEFVGLDDYRAVRDLYEHAARTDAQSVVLVRD